MLSEEKIMEVLEAYDLTQSYRSAGLLCGVDAHTVARYVNARAAGLDPTRLGSQARCVSRPDCSRKGQNAQVSCQAYLIVCSPDWIEDENILTALNIQLSGERFGRLDDNTGRVGTPQAPR